jgi:hypothetical protein
MFKSRQGHGIFSSIQIKYGFWAPLSLLSIVYWRLLPRRKAAIIEILDL